MGIAMARLLAASDDNGPDDGGTEPLLDSTVTDVEDVLSDLAEMRKHGPVQHAS